MKPECREFFTLMHSFKRSSLGLTPSTLSRSEIMTLITIQYLSKKKEEAGMESGVKISDISDKLETSKPDVSKKIRLLEEKQLISRKESAKDKRVTFIYLTEKGKTELRKGQEEVEVFFDHVFERMGEEDTLEFMRLCGRILKAMDEEMKERKLERKE